MITLKSYHQSNNWQGTKDTIGCLMWIAIIHLLDISFIVALQKEKKKFT